MTPTPDHIRQENEVILSVYGVGDEVSLGKDLTGTVVEILIRAQSHISYKVSWWDKNTRKSEWLEACEVTGVDGETERLSIGFLSADDELKRGKR